jgi:hypothetical protein
VGISRDRIHRIIREEFERAVDEMAYAGSMGPRRGAVRMDNSYNPDANPEGAEKFARSGRFRALAEKHFAHVPHPVWTAALISDPLGRSRGRSVALHPTGIRTLRTLGFEIPDGLAKGDTVILYTTTSVAKRTLATPWMIVHAMFDRGDNDRSIVPESFDTLLNSIIYGGGPESKIVDSWMSDRSMFMAALTMKSARKRMINTLGDAISEIVCQEILTTDGFRVNDDGVDPELASVLRDLKPAVERIAEEWRELIRGKLITIRVN